MSRVCLRLLVWLGSHDHARSYLLDSLDNDLFPFFQSFGDNYLALVARANFDRPNIRFVILAKDSDLITSLQLDQRPLGYQQRAGNRSDYGPRLGKLSRTQRMLGIRKIRSNQDGAGRWVNLAIQERELSLLRINGSVGKHQLS